ncbi:MAG: hypothetical protein DI531_08195 [Brevundimonas sp.]|uniref:hypothetical protein n=1 Tax=Brevundimonas sp. TaxID=1871086 RepID=UPI000DB6925E|nr:hypothetical protein [Brevundimonas sp.]PZU74143.1 MAG: hypothetical protein DI531_08195 [Brevundimonas sp.]
MPRFITRTFNFATPWGWALSGLALIAFIWLIVGALGGLGFRFDPLDLARKRADRAEDQAVVATINAGARSREVAGERDTTRRVETARARIHQAEAIAADFTTQARAAPDANHPLDPDRLARLRLADERLCQAHPAVCPADAAPAGDARDR